MGPLALQLCGDYDTPMVHSAKNWLMEPNAGNQWLFYGTYLSTVNHA